MTDDDSNVRQGNRNSIEQVVASNAHQRLNDNMENEYSIEAFRQKLDELTESLDNNIQLDRILQDAINTTPIKDIEAIRSQVLYSDTTNTMVLTDDPILTETTTPQLRRFPMMAETE